MLNRPECRGKNKPHFDKQKLVNGKDILGKTENIRYYKESLYIYHIDTK